MRLWLIERLLRLPRRVGGYRMANKYRWDRVARKCNRIAQGKE